MTELPICVADWDDEHPATMLGCGVCGFERHCTDDEMGISEMVAPCTCCYRERGGWLDWKYQQGEECVSCGRLDWSMPITLPGHRGVCSRACQLQVEYAESLGSEA